MFKIIFFITLAVVYTKIEGKTLVDFKPDEGKAIMEVVKKCVPDGHSKDDYLKTIRDGKFYEDDDFKNFVFCGYHDSGYTTDDGRIIPDKAAKAYVDHNDELLNVFKECDLPGSDPTDTTFRFFKCFQDKSPYLMNVS